MKAGKTTHNQIFTKFNEKFKPELSIRFSMNNLTKDGKILNIPLFLVEYINKFVK